MPACFVKGCHSSDRKKKQGVTFHKFSKLLQSEWLSAAGRDPNLFIVHQKICSEHFNIGDFEQNGNTRRVRNNVIPTKNLPKQSPAEEIIINPGTSSRESKQPTLVLDPSASSSKSMKMEGEMQLDLMDMFSGETKKASNINNVLVEEMPSSPLFIMISSSSNAEVKHETRNIILDFPESKENIKTNLNTEESDTRCQSPEWSSEIISGLSSAFHTYSFNPDRYLIQIKKAKQRGDYFMQKYQNALKTSLRRKKKIFILKRVLQELQKKHPFLD